MVREFLERKYKIRILKGEIYEGRNGRGFRGVPLYLPEHSIYLQGHNILVSRVYANDHTVHMELYACNPPDDNDLWNHDGATIDEGVQDLLKAPLFDGKTILEVEQDIEWIDS